MKELEALQNELNYLNKLGEDCAEQTVTLPWVGKPNAPVHANLTKIALDETLKKLGGGK